MRVTQAPLVTACHCLLSAWRKDKPGARKTLRQVENAKCHPNDAARCSWLVTTKVGYSVNTQQRATAARLDPPFQLEPQHECILCEMASVLLSRPRRRVDQRQHLRATCQQF